MKYASGDIWYFHDLGYPIVVPTNIGWTSAGENVMGRGVARQAAAHFPGLPLWYGRKCRQYQAQTPVLYFVQGPLWLFPVKPLASNPLLSWQQPASLELIERSAHQLAAKLFRKPVYLPLVGCGNGRLSIDQVLPVLEQVLDDRFILVRYDI